MNDTEPITYEIRTLRDIFTLPTIEKMKTCLDELTDAMMAARAANDLIVDTDAMRQADVAFAIEWPEVSRWVDDGKGEIRASVRGPNGEELLFIELAPKSSHHSTPEDSVLTSSGPTPPSTAESGC